MIWTLKDMVDWCEAGLEKIPVSSHKFINDMIVFRDKHGENFYATPGQMRYLTSLICRHSLAPTKEDNEKPKSKLEMLREKRDKLLRDSERRAKKERERQRKQDCVFGRIAAGGLFVSDGPTTAIRHDKTRHRANAINPSGVKRRVPRKK
jgi:hypothetical protein